MSKRSDTVLRSRIDRALARSSSMIRDSHFCEPSDVAEWVDSTERLSEDVQTRCGKLLYRIGIRPSWLKDDAETFLRTRERIVEKGHRHNMQLAERTAELMSDSINPVNCRDLNHQQLTSICMDVRTRLLIAGAGTGKTATITGLAKYLVKVRDIPIDRILFLSFTNSAVDELGDRIGKEIGARPDICTFHRLGLRVLASSGGRKPRIFNDDLPSTVMDLVTIRMNDPEYMHDLAIYLSLHYRYGSYSDPSRNREDHERFLKENPLITLNGESVKSRGEASIADILHINGIEYTYEEPYPKDTRDIDHAQYIPDFHIDGTDVYIEYFGVDRNGEVAPFMKGRTPHASKRYGESMKWKRSIHASNGTRLIELYAYQFWEGTLERVLMDCLESAGITPKPMDDNQLFAEVSSDGRVLKRISEQIASSILLMKGSGRSFDDVFTGADERAQSFRRILDPIHRDYDGLLSSRGEIDFEDMLTSASKVIGNGGWHHRYDYVIVDEYQDTSRSRVDLLKAMRRDRDYRLFCVGDDWQSIYRFTGCDVGFILGFEEHWGPSEICRLDRTYRYSDNLLSASCGFMNSAPNQIPKDMVCDSGQATVLKVIDAKDRKDGTTRMRSIMRNIPDGEDILILGRHHHDVVMLESGGLKWSPMTNGKMYRITDPDLPGRRIVYMTIHGSKGLEADHVFVIGNIRGVFPDPTSESPVMPLLMEGGDRTDEERRLFYVAITRAKKGAYLVTEKGRESQFISEMQKIIGTTAENDTPMKDLMVCPLCGRDLVLREGRYGRFYGCTGYPNGCRFTRKYCE